MPYWFSHDFEGVWIVPVFIICGAAVISFAQKIHALFFVMSDLRGGLVLVLSVVGLLFSQALAMLSVFFACEVMPTVVR